MKNTLFKGKSTRTKIFSVITVVGLLLILCINFGLTALVKDRLILADLTPEGFYTMSDKMEEICHQILDRKDEDGNKRQIKITFCTDPDYLTESDSLRATYFMALALRNKFDNVEVKTVNVRLDPTAVSMYKTTSRDEIKVTDMIVSYGAKYRIVDITGFWTSNNFSYNGEYRMASILASLTAINQPVAYFLTDHGETYYDPDNQNSDMSKSMGAFADLLTERGLKIKTLKISEVDAIPDDCALLIINNPTVDFTADPDRLNEFGYISDTEKIDRYLLRSPGAMLLNKAYDVKLPTLEALAKEWGIAFGESQLFDEDNALFSAAGSSLDASVFTGEYDEDDQNFGYAYYGSYASLSSAPKMVFSNTGYVYCSFANGEEMIEQGNAYASRNYAEFMSTSGSATYSVDGGTARGKYALVAAGVRSVLDHYTSERSNSYMFCTNSADFMSNELLGNPSYANYDIMATVISSISRTDRYASIELGGLSLNSPNFGGKQSVSMTLSQTDTKVYSPDASEVVKINKGLSNGARTVYTIIVMIPAAAAIVLGAVVFIKRKFL